jgi:hypothetical protein
MPSLICTKTTSWFVKKVLDPVDKWVTKQQQNCKKLKWYDPRKWICWIVTITIKIVIWVIREILVPIILVTCSVITALLFLLLAPFAVVIDGLSQNSHCLLTLQIWLVTRSKITFVSKIPTGAVDSYLYTFTCECADKTSKDISVTASNDDDAAQKAEKECAAVCS